MRPTAIDAELESEFAAVAESSGCELVHVEIRGNTLRLYVDRPEGVTVDDCAAVSREISALLDVHDFGDRRYLLEVSSPGLDRKLYRPEDYERFRGRSVRVTFRIGGLKKTLVGRLEEYRSNGASGGEISVVESATGERCDIPLSDIEVTRLVVEL